MAETVGLHTAHDYSGESSDRLPVIFDLGN
jgi:hypothetical protein